ncbi:carbamoyltransferase family protein [Vibrio sp. MEBiC08052]|uniref:carbamoyltransferase family protein n=1 Tax=Vibrio sp. MEBiC08052 TaxID=1761910 RepID=UPI0007408694|nr:carbamoyltransferase [Vibrio sp. MEBiC08052]KUI98003.1 putative carbamoyl transferase [Vibrio sp. MEBiC08052]
MYILGISAFYHDSAACLILNGEIIAAAQEERFTRKKHDDSFPVNAVQYCVTEANITASEIDYVVFYEKPLIKFERLLETYLAFVPHGFSSFRLAMSLWMEGKLFQKSLLIDGLCHAFESRINWKEKLRFSEHHLSHAASAFFPSPFERAAVLTLDGVGEWTTTSLAIGHGNQLNIIKEMHFPHSLGLLYSSFTYYLGFKVNSGEYKMMGLAPYGMPKYTRLIKEKLITIGEDGSFHLDMRYFNYCSGLTMTNKRFHDLFGGLPRRPESTITQREMDIAASIQKVTEEVITKLARSIAQETGERNLCLAGGVALNSVANGLILREKIFDNIWIQPASGDAGGALGAALAYWHIHHQGERRCTSALHDHMQGSYLGPAYSDHVIEQTLNKHGARYDKLTTDELINKVALLLREGKVIGWMQGRMEFGPRALGARSILADPRAPAMQKKLNLKIKFRESFRPFAPSVLREHMADWFMHDIDSPYMLLVDHINTDKQYKANDSEATGIKKLHFSRSVIPAVTHVDYSARIQTVHHNTNPKYYALIKRFYELTDCPVIVNTSFNIRGEPIVCTPEDAFRCFMGTEMDILAIGNYLLIKDEQDISLRNDYVGQYELD